MFNSAEHEISNAHKYKNIKKFSIFSGSDKPRMLFFLLKNANDCWHFNIYELENFHAQLSITFFHNLGARRRGMTRTCPGTSTNETQERL